MDSETDKPLLKLETMIGFGGKHLSSSTFIGRQHAV